MRDYLAWRLAFGVATPSTNTVVQPEYDDMRPPCVTNHLARLSFDDIPVRSHDDFECLSRLPDLSAGAALPPAAAPPPPGLSPGTAATPPHLYPVRFRRPDQQ